MLNKKTIVTTLLLFCVLAVYSQRTFVHPGLSHKQSDFDRMKVMVAAKMDPWYTSFVNLSNDGQAKHSYTVRGNPSFTTVTDGGINYSAITSDVKAAYLNAIMWAVTGDVRHADKAVEILNAWQNLTCYTGGGTESLNAGRIGWQLVEAAEIIQSTYDGWKPEDIQKFKEMLVYPGYSNTARPSSVNNNNGTFYWRAYQGDPARHGNQDIFGWRLIMAMGVFLDNEIMYDRALRYFTGLPGRADDIAYTSGPPINSTNPTEVNNFFRAYSRNGQQNAIPDYGYDGVLKYYIWENGQSQESSRDQDHCALGLGMVASMAEIAWNQGDDIYSMYDNRILTGYEWGLRYNLSYLYSFPDQPTPWEPSGFTTEEGLATYENGLFIQRSDRTGRWYSLNVNPHYESNFVSISRGNVKGDKRPVCEMAIAHYGIRAGLDAEQMKWTKRTLEISNQEYGYEKTGWSLDHLGWGGLTFHRKEGMAGDPVHFVSGKKIFEAHQVPGTIQAVDFDYFTGNGQGRTFYDQTGATANSYRSDSQVDIREYEDGKYIITDMQAGEWLNYTIRVPFAGAYKISVKYRAENDGGKLKMLFNDNETLPEVSLPASAELSGSLLYDEVVLTAGAQVLKILVTEASNGLELSEIRMQGNATGEKNVLLTGEDKNGAIQLTWSLHNIIPTNQEIYRAEEPSFESAMRVAENRWETFYVDNSADIDKDYYYWVKCYYEEEFILSNMLEISSLAASFGLIDHVFTEDTHGWEAVTTGSTCHIQDAKLYVQMALQANGTYRGDIMLAGGAVLHAGNFPVLAMKTQRPARVNITFDTERGPFGGGARWTGIINADVLYYDLTTGAFVYNGANTWLPLDEPYTFDRFQFKVADVTSGETSYTVDWIKTFRSMNELNAYLGLTGQSPVSEATIVFHVKDKILYIHNPGEPYDITIWGVEGKQIKKIIHISENRMIIPFAQNGVYIIEISKGNEKVKTFKIVI